MAPTFTDDPSPADARDYGVLALDLNGQEGPASIVVVPEPTELAALAPGVALLSYLKRRRERTT